MIDAISGAALACIEPVLRRTTLSLGIAVVYHRLSDTQAEKGRYVVRPTARARLDSDLGFLSGRFQLVKASELQRATTTRRRGDRFPLAITFDDDCKSYRDIAEPLLKRHGATATFFITGASLDGANPFWWESLDTLARDSPLDVRRVALVLGLCDDGSTLPASLDELASEIRRLTPAKRLEVERRCHVIAPTESRESGLSRSSVQALSIEGFELGFHTRWHHSLPTLSDRELTDALCVGRDEVEIAARSRCTSIAYPYGDASLRVADAARKEGFSTGFTMEPAAVTANTDPLLMVRLVSSHRSTYVLARRIAFALTRGAWTLVKGDVSLHERRRSPS